ncbi:CRISPR system precrRNA processing endoribonuclease RAMP protein Cas6 [Actinokineospora sp.]|uniref:CRISPR system precrRNA processing endoribonuclease RAMP protein Cas6 n=1 Tax=Actinokineospora sp. TaxID=1872133 RepID=UPI004037CDF5
MYAVVLKAVRQVDEVLAGRMHDSPKFKGFTLTPLLGDDDLAPTTPGCSAGFAVSVLDDAHTATVLAGLNATSSVLIGRTEYRVVSAESVESVPYEQIVREAEPRATWEFDLITPVSFATARGQGARRQQPWPDAVRVFTNLADRWAAFAPPGCVLPGLVRGAIDEHLETCAGAVRLAEHLVEPSQRGNENGYRVGSVGWVGWRLAASARLSEVALRGVDALARFGCFAGMGDRTAMGMGYVRLRPEPPR